LSLKSTLLIIEFVKIFSITSCLVEIVGSIAEVFSFGCRGADCDESDLLSGMSNKFPNKYLF
jgi:hypothetical protein